MPDVAICSFSWVSTGVGAPFAAPEASRVSTGVGAPRDAAASAAKGDLGFSKVAAPEVSWVSTRIGAPRDAATA